MKKIIIFIALLIVIVSSVYALPDKFTDDFRNGWIFDDNEDYGRTYTIGCIDTFYFVNNAKMEALYPNFRMGEIVDKVIAYYRKNPTKKSRPIADVIINGCE